MTSIELVGVWIGYGEGFATQLVFNAAVDVSPVLGMSGQTMVTASGRIIAVSEPGTTSAYKVSIGLLDRTNREALAALIGQEIELRTGRGDLVFGIFWDYPVAYLRGPDLADVSFTLNEITHVVEV